MKYIDADRLIAEIETLKDEYTDIAIDSQRGWVNANSVIDDLERLQSQIDSLQQEQSCDTCTNDKGCVTCKDGELWEGKEQPSEDLESEIEKYFQGLWPGMETVEQCNTDRHFTPPAIMRLASHFYELGKQSKEGELTMAEEVKVKGWVARDKANDLYFFTYKPHRTDGVFHSEISEDILHLSNDMFPELSWETEPIEVELLPKKLM